MSELKPLVSIICNAYNHEKYIAEALESFVMQKTSFPFEILVHDDASTDKTASIIQRYYNKYPQMIRPIFQKENQYSKGKRIISQIQFPRAQGEYIALCEGDDYWTDPYKLQRQIDALKRNPDLKMCAHAAVAVSSKNKKTVSFISPRKKFSIIPVQDVILGGGDYLATNSLVFKRELYENPPKFRECGIDYFLQIHGAIDKGILFLPNYMSAYRVMSESSWTKKMSENKNKRYEFNKKILYALKELNKCTNQEYEKTIRKQYCKVKLSGYEYLGEYKKILRLKYLKYFMLLKNKDKAIIILNAFFPSLVPRIKQIYYSLIEKE